MTARIPTQRNISALLAKAGFTKSTRRPGRIKGLHEHTEGYAVQGAYEGVVRVRHKVTSFRQAGTGLRTATMLVEYAKAIEAAGFAVQHESDRLTVTARPEEG